MNSAVPSGDVTHAGISDREGSPVTPNFESLNSLNSKPKLASKRPRGGSKVRRARRTDRRPTFIRKMLDLNTKSPGVGGSKVGSVSIGTGGLGAQTFRRNSENFFFRAALI